MNLSNVFSNSVLFVMIGSALVLDAVLVGSLLIGGVLSEGSAVGLALMILLVFVITGLSLKDSFSFASMTSMVNEFYGLSLSEVDVRSMYSSDGEGSPVSATVGGVSELVSMVKDADGLYYLVHADGKRFIPAGKRDN